MTPSLTLPHNYRERATEALGVGLAFLLAFSAFLLARPYEGIVHDSLLYTAQALYRLHPEIFSNDPFFAFGSQDKFTIFSAFHAYWIRWLGVEQAGFALTALGKVLWLIGIIWMSTALLPARVAVFFVSAIVTLPSWYDGHDIFSYAESFVTARLYAEAVCLLALGCWLRKQWRSACLLEALALLLHPLIALPGALVFFCCWTETHRRQAIYALIGGAAILSLLLGLKIQPFASFWVTLDEEWLSLLLKRAPYLFLENWHNDWIGKLLTLVLIGVFARSRLTTGWRGLADFLSFVLPIIIAISLLGASYFHNHLITQLQLWRIFWIAQILAFLLVAKLFADTKPWPTHEHIPPSLLVCALVVQGMGGAVLAAVVTLIPVWHRWHHEKDARLKLLTPNLLRNAAILFSIFFVLTLCLLELKMNWLARSAKSGNAWHAILASPLFILPLAWFVTGKTTTPGLRKTLPTAIAVLVLTGIAVNSWLDGAKTSAKIALYGAQESLATLQRLIPEDATVYWPGNLYATWFWLQRPFYVSKMQGAGSVFSRQSALEISRRQEHLHELSFSDGIIDFEPRPEHMPQQRQFNKALGIELCKDKQLDYLIIPGASLEESETSFATIFKQRASLIGCDKLRASAPS